MEKTSFSAFYDTPLVSKLNELDIDTLIVTGSSTSGCVRGTVTDAHAYSFTSIVPEECTFDRFEASHEMSLFDIEMKFSYVMSRAEVENYISGL